MEKLTKFLLFGGESVSVSFYIMDMYIKVYGKFYYPLQLFDDTGQGWARGVQLMEIREHHC